MDGVELVIQTEDRFGIEISNEEAERIRAPGMLVDLVLSKVQKSSERYCRSQRAFYILRAALTQEFGLGRGTLTPSTRFSGLQIPEAPKEYWLRLQAAVGARSWPALAYTPGCQMLRMALWLIVFAAGCWCFWMLTVSYISALFNIVALALTAVGTLLLTAKSKEMFDQRWYKMRTVIPLTICTLRDLVPYVESSSRISWTRETVAMEVKTIVLEVLCIELEIYREDADFVTELGLS